MKNENPNICGTGGYRVKKIMVNTTPGEILDSLQHFLLHIPE